MKRHAHHNRLLPRRYLELSQGGHSPNTLKHAFALHTAYRQTGSMLNAVMAWSMSSEICVSPGDST